MCSRPRECLALADHERPDAVRVAEADDAVAEDHRDDRIAADERR